MFEWRLVDECVPGPLLVPKSGDREGEELRLDEQELALCELGPREELPDAREDEDREEDDLEEWELELCLLGGMANNLQNPFRVLKESGAALSRHRPNRLLTGRPATRLYPYLIIISHFKSYVPLSYFSVSHLVSFQKSSAFSIS